MMGRMPPQPQTMPGQSPPAPHPAPAGHDERFPPGTTAPNTGPEKVKGVFAHNDIVKVAGRWTKDYYYLRPVPGTDGAVSWVIRDCGCGGPQQVPTDHLVHQWHHEHGDAAPA